MLFIAPNYYNEFKCIADKCKHSCCIGWEIDIDEKTLEYYKSLKGDLGEKIRKNISGNEETAQFILGKDERCPFLKENGLCEIICEKGEDSLCDICADHPRFRNFFSSRTEIGLGLCCESAAKLILENREKVRLIILSDNGEENLIYEGEKDFFNEREKIFEILQNREKNIETRIKELLEEYGIFSLLPLKEVQKSYLTLERLDEKWTEILHSLDNEDECKLKFFEAEKFETVFEQLLVYLIFRHLPLCFEEFNIEEIISFIVNAFRLIRAICVCHEKRYGKISIEDIEEYCRMFSSEAEYTTETKTLI